MKDCLPNNKNADVFRHFLLLLLGIAVVFPIFIGTDALWSGETYFAEAAGELRERFLSSYDWRELLKVTFNYKPGNVTILPGLLLQCPINFIINPSEFSLRISSVLALLVWLVLIWFMGKRFYPAETCLWAVWMLTGSLGVVFWSRFASADIWCSVFVTASIFWSLCRIESPGFLTAFVMTIFAVIGAGVGGNLVYVFLPFVILLPYNIHFDCGRKVSLLKEAAGFLTGIFLLVLCCVVASHFNEIDKFHISLNLPSELGNWLSDYLRRCWSKGDGWKTIINIPRLLLPWSIFLLPLLLWYLKIKRLSDTDRMLLGGGASGALLLMVFTNGRWNVFLALLPFFVLPLADSWRVGLKNNERFADFLVIILRYSAIIVACFASCSFVTFFILNGFRVVQEMPRIALIILPLAGIIAVIFMLLESFPKFNYQSISCLPEKAAAATIALSLLSWGLLIMFCPHLTIYRTEKEFFLESEKKFLFCTERVPVLCFGEKEIDGGFLFYSKFFNKRFYKSGTAVQNVQRNNFDKFKAWIDKQCDRSFVVMCRRQDVLELRNYVVRYFEQQKNKLLYSFEVPEVGNDDTVHSCRQIERLVTDRNNSYRIAWKFFRRDN